MTRLRMEQRHGEGTRDQCRSTFSLASRRPSPSLCRVHDEIAERGSRKDAETQREEEVGEWAHLKCLKTLRLGILSEAGVRFMMGLVPLPSSPIIRFECPASLSPAPDFHSPRELIIAHVFWNHFARQTRTWSSRSAT